MKDVGREIAIFKSEDGRIWQEHQPPVTDNDVNTLLSQAFEDASATEKWFDGETVRITTINLPHYFAIVSRIHSDIEEVCPVGGTIKSSILPGVQLSFPPDSVTKSDSISIKVLAVDKEALLGVPQAHNNDNLMIAVMARHHEFIKPVTLHFPIASITKTEVIQYPGDIKVFSKLAGQDQYADWIDITDLGISEVSNDIITFQTAKADRFFITTERNEQQALNLAHMLYRRFTNVPYLAKIAIFARRLTLVEAKLRIFCATEDRMNDAMIFNQYYTEISRSKHIEIYDNCSISFNVTGDMIPIVKSSKDSSIVFKPFAKNHLYLTIKVGAANDCQPGYITATIDSINGDFFTVPIYGSEIVLPKQCFPLVAFEYQAKAKHLQRSRNDANSGIKDTLKLIYIADALQSDWVLLARNLYFEQDDIITIQKNYRYVSEQAFVLLDTWIKRNNCDSRSEELERALHHINRDDIIQRFMTKQQLHDNIVLI